MDVATLARFRIIFIIFIIKVGMIYWKIKKGKAILQPGENALK